MWTFIAIRLTFNQRRTTCECAWYWVTLVWTFCSCDLDLDRWPWYMNLTVKWQFSVKAFKSYNINRTDTHILRHTWPNALPTVIAGGKMSINCINYQLGRPMLYKRTLAPHDISINWWHGFCLCPEKSPNNIFPDQQVMWLALPRSEPQALVCLSVRGAPWWVSLQHFIMLQLFFIVQCGIARCLYAMLVFELRASSSSPGLPLCQISFLSRPPLLS